MLLLSPLKHIAPYLLLLIAFFASSLTSSAQKYKVGERVEVDVNGDGKWVKATIKEVNFGPYVNGDYLVRLDAPDAIGGIEYTFLSNHFNQIRAMGSTTNSITSNCSFGPPPGTFTNSSPASIALFKHIVYDKLNNFATGVPGSPVRIGLSFLSFETAKAYKNTVSVKPGRGAVRINEAAPADATVYPATVTYIICEDYHPGIKRKKVETKYEFFMDRFGKWNASQLGYVDKTTVLE